MTYLEETYYHRLNPPQGFAVQRVYTEDGSLDETMAVRDHDVTLVPAATTLRRPLRLRPYYLNVMAGPCANGASRTTPTTTGSRRRRWVR
jgi:5-deoxy-glucuronate isomerase